MARLVQWDIDHTLIDTRGVGRELSATAFERTTGQPMRRQAKIDGITEPVIFRETARLHGLTTGLADFERFAEALREEHQRRRAELATRGRALPGTAAVMASLATMGILQTVVTGNIRAVAEIKLQVFGLDRHIRWECGAYGEDHDQRADLVQLSLQRTEMPASQVVLIGDTPADVQGAHANAVKVIAVASGRSSEEELRDAGADLVLPDLRDTHAVTALVGG